MVEMLAGKTLYFSDEHPGSRLALRPPGPWVTAIGEPDRTGMGGVVALPSSHEHRTNERTHEQMLILMPMLKPTLVLMPMLTLIMITPIFVSL